MKMLDFMISMQPKGARSFFASRFFLPRGFTLPSGYTLPSGPSIAYRRGQRWIYLTRFADPLSNGTELVVGSLLVPF